MPAEVTIQGRIQMEKLVLSQYFGRSRTKTDGDIYQLENSKTPPCVCLLRQPRQPSGDQQRTEQGAQPEYFWHWQTVTHSHRLPETSLKTVARGSWSG
jgi:hypothetical protein